MIAMQAAATLTASKPREAQVFGFDAALEPTRAERHVLRWAAPTLVDSAHRTGFMPVDRKRRIVPPRLTDPPRVGAHRNEELRPVQTFLDRL
jgi:hypothetical protein